MSRSTWIHRHLLKHILLSLLLPATILIGCGGDVAPTATAPTASAPTASEPTATVATGDRTAPTRTPTETPAATTTAEPTVPPAPTETPTPSPTPTLGPDELACEVEGYACSLGETSDETLQQAIGYADTAEERMRAGASAFETVEWLQEQEGVEDPITDGRAIIYRVAGSVPFIVEHPGVAEVTRNESSRPGRWPPDVDLGDALTSLSLPAFPEVPAVHAQPIVSEPTDVVGSQRADRNTKRALVLAPYLWQFGASDDAPVAAEALGNTRWYEGNVTYVANADETDRNVGIEHFMGWEQYDTIHVSTHGKSICPEDQGCMTYLNTGYRVPETQRDAFAEQHSDLKGVGVGFVDTRDTDENPDVNQIELVVVADFFKNYYGSGSLKNKVIYFSACEMLAQSDMLNALRTASENTDFFAWTYTVKAADARAVAEELYDKMAAQGQAAGDAYRRIPDGAKLGRPSEATGYDVGLYYGLEESDEGQFELVDRTRTTDFVHHVLGQENNHVREVITLLDPDDESVLTPGTVYPIDGTLGDGEPEYIELLFRVEGYTQPEIEQEDILISFTLDDESILAYRAFLPPDAEDVEVTQQGDYEWLVRFTDVEIPDQQPGDQMRFGAQLQLPGGDESVHTVEPILTSRLDVRATIQEPLEAGQSVVFTYDRDTQTLRADMQAEGGGATFFHDERAERFYVPNPETGGYWFYETPRGETEAGWAFLRIVRVSEWTRHQLKEAGFAEEEFACAGGETCYRYTGQEAGQTLRITYDENDRLVEFRIQAPDGNGVVTYEYGEYSVQVPTNASPAPMPGLMPRQLPGGWEVPAVP